MRAARRGRKDPPAINTIADAGILALASDSNPEGEQCEPYLANAAELEVESSRFSRTTISSRDTTRPHVLSAHILLAHHKWERMVSYSQFQPFHDQRARKYIVSSVALQPAVILILRRVPARCPNLGQCSHTMHPKTVAAMRIEGRK